MYMHYNQGAAANCLGFPQNNKNVCIYYSYVRVSEDESLIRMSRDSFSNQKRVITKFDLRMRHD